jgi:thioredoxin reductase (NADPH)
MTYVTALGSQTFDRDRDGCVAALSITAVAGLLPALGCMDPLILIFYGLPALVVLGWFVFRRRSLERTSALIDADSRSAGLHEPASLHPVIDPSRCIGCGSCVKACPEEPEHHVLGIIGGRAQLIGPSDCIGHGACKAACPVEAISLVFGSERRGAEIPVLTPQFETSVPGIFIAGELGGMGLIRNALEQGRQAVEAIHAARPQAGDRLDLLIVGAGPAGFAASLTALSKRMRFVTIEQESLGGCVFQYPRGKVVMTAPATVPLVGKVNLRHTSKEALLEFWMECERKTGVRINYHERVDDITQDRDGFIVRTSRAQYQTRSVLLAIGRRGTPRKLGVPGEDLPKVVYRLIDPEQYAGQNVLVVGGGDSALEAATSVAEAGGSSVVLSYRGDAFDRAKQRNRERVQSAAAAGRLQVLLNSNVKQIAANSVSIEQPGRVMKFPNDAVIVNAGGVLPADFLRRVGIYVEMKYGTA